MKYADSVQKHWEWGMFPLNLCISNFYDNIPADSFASHKLYQGVPNSYSRLAKGDSCRVARQDKTRQDKQRASSANWRQFTMHNAGRQQNDKTTDGSIEDLILWSMVLRRRECFEGSLRGGAL